MRCALGPAGVLDASEKREGDGASPAGDWPLRWVYYRPDREAAPNTGLPLVPLKPEDGWCDDPASGALYNRPITTPNALSHERLWREDHVYDIIVVLGHNDDPPIPGMGSAIFLHLKRGDYEPTEGCVALAREDLLAVLAAAKLGDSLEIGE
ncbi:MAG: L,D-transpeptidase family protein [Pseudomonadota bacterium]